MIMDFNTWKEFYGWGFASKEQVKQAVKQNVLTITQYKEITGDDYIIAAPIIKSSVPETPNIQPSQPVDVKPIVPEVTTQPTDIKPIMPDVTVQPINPATETTSQS